METRSLDGSARYHCGSNSDSSNQLLEHREWSWLRCNSRTLPWTAAELSLCSHPGGCALSNRRLTFVTTYDPSQSDLGGASWVDRALIGAFEDSFDVNIHQICGDGPSSVPLEIRKSKVLMGRTLLRMLSLQEPYQVAKFRVSPAWKREVARVQQLAAELGSDDYIVTSQWPALLLLADAGIESDLHIAHNVDTVIARSHDPLLFKWMGNEVRMETIERAILSKPKVVLAISGSDSERIQKWGIDCKHLSIAPEDFEERPRSSTVIGFIGKATWPPNAEAIRLLVEEVLPRVREHLPSTCVVLAGRDSEHWSNAEGVTGIGPVDDLAEFYDRSDLVVVPRLGESTGISVKMLEAVTYGRPVVVPSIIARDAGLKTGAILADDVNAMVDVISDYFRERSIDSQSKKLSSRETWAGAVKLSQLEAQLTGTSVVQSQNNEDAS